MEIQYRQTGALQRRLDIVTECVWLAVIIIIPLYFNPFTLHAFYFAKSLVLIFLVCMLLGFMAAQWIMYGRRLEFRGQWGQLLKRSPLQVAAIIFGLAWIISTFFSIMPYKSLWGNLTDTLGIFTNLAWITYFLVISQKLKNKRQVFRAIYALLISSGLVALIGILQFMDPRVMAWFEFTGRVFSTDGNALSLSAFLAMILPITLAIIIVTWYGPGAQKKSKIIFSGLLVLFALQVVCLVLAQYSITMLQFIIGIFTFFALIGIFLRKKMIIASSLAFLVLIAVVAAVLLGPMMMPENPEKITTNQDARISAAEQVGLPTLSIRVDIWKSTAGLIIESPVIPYSKDGVNWLRRIIGYGPETYLAVSQAAFPEKLKSWYTFDSLVISQPENHYLNLAVTIGMLGLAIFMGMLILFFIISFKKLAHSKDRESIVIISAFIAAILQYCVHIFFNPSVIVPELVLWLVMGMMVALNRMDKGGEATIPETKLVENRDSNKPIFRVFKLTLSALVIIVFMAMGIYLTVPSLMANMKMKSGFSAWDYDKNAALAYCREATLIEPHQSYYLSYVGNMAFIMAQETNDAVEKEKYFNISETAYLKAIEQEPQIAIWYYRLADIDVYRAINGSKNKINEALSLYEKADRIFPGNAIILNKWGFALYLNGNNREADRKFNSAELNDPAWIQTSYFKGLVQASEGHTEGAGALLQSTSQSKIDSVRYFINFCSLAAQFGKASLIRDTLISRLSGIEGDWIAYAFLGVADVYSDDFDIAVNAFRKAAELVPDEYSTLLAGTAQAMFRGNSAYSSASQEIVNNLMNRSIK